MKKLLVALLAGLSIAACSHQDDSSQTTSSEASAPVATPAAEASEPEAAPTAEASAPAASAPEASAPTASAAQ